jgi:large subunit ribosomal protein L17
MRKRKHQRKLSLKTDQRRALLRSLAEALFTREKIKTTEAKAKELARFAESLVTVAKRKNNASLRKISGLFSTKLSKKIMTEIAARYEKRNGGYTRILKFGPRKSDSAKMAQIELVK